MNHSEFSGGTASGASTLHAVRAETERRGMGDGGDGTAAKRSSTCAESHGRRARHLPAAGQAGKRFGSKGSVAGEQQS